MTTAIHILKIASSGKILRGLTPLERAIEEAGEASYHRKWDHARADGSMIYIFRDGSRTSTTELEEASK